MERILFVRQSREFILVGARDDEDALDFREHPVVVVYMLDRLETRNDVDAVAFYRKIFASADHKAQGFVAVSPARMRDGILVHIDADHAVSCFAQQRASV